MTAKYKEFSIRLIEAMKANGYLASRSPSGICIHTLSVFADASEQICRRYIRGDALPEYDRVKQIAKQLMITPGWLLFGEQDLINLPKKQIEDGLLHYILSKSYYLFRDETLSQKDYPDFVMKLIQDVREIDTSNDNLEKIIDLAIGSISSFTEKKYKEARHELKC